MIERRTTSARGRRDSLCVAVSPTRYLLDDLGPPADIVAAAQPDRAPKRRGAREVFGLILLVTGFPPILGWLAGVGLVLSSPLWTARQSCSDSWCDQVAWSPSSASASRSPRRRTGSPAT